MLDATIHHPPAGGCSRRNGWGRGGGGGGRGCGGTSTSSQGGSAGRKTEPPRHGGVTSASAQRSATQHGALTPQYGSVVSPNSHVGLRGKWAGAHDGASPCAAVPASAASADAHTGSRGWRRGGGGKRAMRSRNVRRVLASHPGLRHRTEPTGLLYQTAHTVTPVTFVAEQPQELAGVFFFFYFSFPPFGRAGGVDPQRIDSASLSVDLRSLLTFRRDGCWRPAAATAAAAGSPAGFTSTYHVASSLLCSKVALANASTPPRR